MDSGDREKSYASSVEHPQASHGQPDDAGTAFGASAEGAKTEALRAEATGPAAMPKTTVEPEETSGVVRPELGVPPPGDLYGSAQVRVRRLRAKIEE